MTDFGTRDPYVAAMKGVIAARTVAAIVDLTHEIAPFDVFEGAWFLRSVALWWPEGTIFVGVVDPGVGTSRRIVAVDVGGRVFVAPDNGLLTFVGRGAAYDVTNEALFLPNGSSTFHGRDRFAPVAAALANGLTLADVGPRINDLVTLDYTPPQYDETEVRGTIVSIDRFGNGITDIERSRIPFAPFAVRVHGHTIERMERNYGDAESGAFLIVGSTGHIEISIANDSAAERLGLARRERVELRPL